MSMNDIKETSSLILLLAKRLDRTAKGYTDFRKGHTSFDYEVGKSKSTLTRTCQEIRMACSDIIKELKP